MNCPRCKGQVVRFDPREEPRCLACGWVQYDDDDLALALEQPRQIGRREWKDPTEQVERRRGQKHRWRTNATRP